MALPRRTSEEVFWLWPARSNWWSPSPVGFMLNVLFVCLFIYTLWTVSTCCYQLWDFPLDLSQPITGSLASPSSAWKSLEKVVVYKAASGKAVNRLASDWSWSHLNIGPALWLEVVPLWKTRGILQYKILPGGSPFERKINYISAKTNRLGSPIGNRILPW